jgi:hypothetical protein
MSNLVYNPTSVLFSFLTITGLYSRLVMQPAFLKTCLHVSSRHYNAIAVIGDNFCNTLVMQDSATQTIKYSQIDSQRLKYASTFQCVISRRYA